MTPRHRPKTLGSAAALLVQVAAVKPRLHDAITDALNAQPRAVDLNPSSTPSPWCWTHEREVAACHREDLLCDGETIRSKDPTGETAVGHDPARAALRRMARLEERAVALAAEWDDLRRQWLPTADELPDPATRGKLATSGAPGCFFCEAAGLPYSPAMTEQPTTVKSNLKVARYSCRPHYDFIRTTGRAPARNETQHWAQHGKWPKQRAA